MANSNQIRAYFSHLISALGRSKDVYIVAVAHMVPNTISFAPALNDISTLSAILVKPKSVDRPEYAELKESFTLLELSRKWASDPKAVVKTLNKLKLSKKDVVILDIGGYFATSIDEIAKLFKGRILGVMEGTENGVQKYEANAPHTTPIISVARSPLKLPEDYLVASSLVFSIEAVLRDEAEILQTRSAAVIGYGRVGSAISEILRNRGINTVVYDDDPIKLAGAAARGFRACKRLSDALAESSLVVCATGNKSLNLRGFAMLREGCVVASVTSADDELDLPALEKGYSQTAISRNLTRYCEIRGGEEGRSFYLIASGNAANFIHGAVIGPAMQLIEGEKLSAVRSIIDGKVQGNNISVSELPHKDRTRVAEIWNDHFL